MIGAISDVHLSPGQLYDGDLGADLLVCNGDIVNIVPWGLSAWATLEGRRTLQSFWDKCPDDTRMIGGNHDPAYLLKKLVDRYSERPFPVSRYLDLSEYHFVHGHQYALDWFLLRHFSDDITTTLTTCPLTRKAWYAFCRRQGWMATGTPSPAHYSTMIEAVWAWATRRACQLERNIVIGHTHFRAYRDEAPYTMTDLGCNQMVEL